MSDESAKATQALAKLGEKGLDTANRLGEFFNKVLGGGLATLGGAFNDWASVYRYEKALQLADRVDQIHRDRGIEGATLTIPPRLAIPLFQSATLEDDETLQGMWSSLIANAMDPERHVQARRSFIGLLSSIEPLDARLLKLIAEDEKNNPDRHSRDYDSVTGEQRRLNPALGKRNLSFLCQMTGEDEALVAIAIENLARLGLAIDFVTPALGVGSLIPVPVTHREAEITLTFTGKALLEACAV